MKLRTLAAAAILCASLAAPAFAAGGTINVSLQTPIAAKTKVVAGGAVFTCANANCVAQDAPSRALTAATCKAVVKEVGAVAAFGSERKTLAADDLARCNGEAGAALQASN
jgi:hypothetical protein